MGVFKPTNRNISKRLRIKNKKHEIIRNGKPMEVTFKKIANQKFQLEKSKIQVKKQMIIQKVAYKLQILKESVKVQKEHFEEEIKVVKE